jgi:hypothetical protein
MMNSFRDLQMFNGRALHLRGLTVVLTSTIIAMVSIWGALFLLGYVGNSARRIQREHGLRVPSSAGNFVCRGDAWMHIIPDSGAASAFEMSPSDLPSFVSQLKPFPGGASSFGLDDEGCVFPSNPQYHIDRPWRSGNPLKKYCSVSPTGDSVDVQVWTIDSRHVGILLYTDWN